MAASPWAIAIGTTLFALAWLERRYPLRPSRPRNESGRIPHNLILAGSAAAVGRLCEQPLVRPIAQSVERHGTGLLPRLGLRPELEKLLGIVLMDYSLYAWHVLLHRSPLLWQAHQVHHSDSVLDTTTALRFHGLEFLASVPWRLAQVAVLGIRPSTLALWQRLTAVEVLFHHSNLRLPERLERVLGLLVMTPRLHGIHHSDVARIRDSNYSSGLAVWDILHRTRKTAIPQESIEIGLPAQDLPPRLTLTRLLLLPLRRKRGS